MAGDLNLVSAADINLSARDLRTLDPRLTWPDILIQDYLNKGQAITQVTQIINVTLGSMALQNANDVAITGGAISGVTLDATSIITGTLTATTATIDSATITTAVIDDLTVTTLHIGDLTVENLTVNGNTQLGDDAADVVTFVASNVTFPGGGTVSGTLTFVGPIDVTRALTLHDSLVLAGANHDDTIVWTEPALDNTLTIIDTGGDDDFLFAVATQTITNKTIDGDDNTLQDIHTDSLKSRTGDGGDVVTASAAGTSGNLADWDATGNVGDSTYPSSILAGAALTKTDDTNVTLTLGGSPTTSLLRAASLTLGWAGQLGVSRGGTGQGTLTAHGVVIGNGTSGVNVTTSGTSGQILTSNGASADPTFQTATSALGQTLSVANDTNITLTLGGAPTTALLSASSITAGWSGQLSLARGGTGNSLSDPGANVLMGWDDTDNLVEFFTIGSGLTYDHSTHTISASGSGGTVTDFSAGDLSPLFTTSVATSTTTPDLTFALSNASAGTWFGNNTGSPAGGAYNAAGTLSKSDDTNVTLTLGGTPTGSLLNSVSITAGWTGQLSLARGGTGSNLSDPGANSLWGWDDTDNAIGFWTIGAGLSYDHATHTVSATGSGGTVTTFSAGDLSPLFTTSVANPTTTPALTFSLSNAGANSYLGNATGSPAAPSFTSAGALTKTDDTNVTLTLGGSPTVALLAAASLTLGWTGTLAASRGGTGVSSLGDLTKADDTNVTLTLGGTPTGALIKSTSITAGWTGQLALSRGGTGVNLSSPGANRLWGWDNTDGAIGFWTIGSGLSYDHATHTLSSTGSGIGGSTGATDNALLRADGTGGSTLQNSVGVLDDLGNLSGLKSVTATASTSATIVTEAICTDADAVGGPLVSLYRNSSSPANSDVMGAIIFNGQNSTPTKFSFAQMQAVIETVTASSEKGRLEFLTYVSGTQETRMTIGGGVYHPSATGGDKGNNTLNFGTLYQNGTALGTAALKDTGTSGTAVPLLDAGGTWSATNNFGSYSGSGASNGKTISSASSQWVMGSSRNSTGSVNHFQTVNPNGIVGTISTSGTATAYNTSSDGQLKINRHPLDVEIDIGNAIDKLEPLAFDWLRPLDGKPTGERGHGLIAQDVYKIFPDAVSPGHGKPGDEDYQPWGLDYSKLVVYCIAELQSARKRIAALEAQLGKGE